MFGSLESITWGEMAKLYEELCGITCEWIPGMEFAKMAMGNTEVINDGMKFMLYYDRFFNRNVNVEKALNDCGLSKEQFISHKEGLRKCLQACPKDYQPNDWEKAQCDFMDEYINKNQV